MRYAVALHQVEHLAAFGFVANGKVVVSRIERYASGNSVFGKNAFARFQHGQQVISIKLGDRFDVVGIGQAIPPFWKASRQPQGLRSPSR